MSEPQLTDRTLAERRLSELGGQEQCPLSHRVARRFFSGLIGFMLLAIVGLGLFDLYHH